MQEDSNLNLIINELDSLISKIENHPGISNCVVRHALKSIKEKREEMTKYTAQKQAYWENLSYLN